MESYKHFISKHLLAGWIRQTVQNCYNKNEQWANWSGIEFRPNRDEPSYGVYTEYPMAMLGKNEDQLYELWDEREDDPNYKWKFTPPSYQELSNWGYKIICIFDVAIAHKGGIRHVIELVHTSGITNRKIDFCNKYDIQLNIINCDEILDQCIPLICNPDGTLLKNNTSMLELAHHG